MLPGILLGVGLGGLVNGIFLHQVLHWQYFSSIVPVDVAGPRLNTLSDGPSHAVIWLAVLIGLGLLYWYLRRSRRRVWGSAVLWGWILVGWGLFTLIEGLLDHQLLSIHHARPGHHQFIWDMTFLGLGLMLVGVGWTLVRFSARVPVDKS